MLIPDGIDNDSKELEMLNLRQKTLMISAFLNEYGEDATWEEWCFFLYKHKMNGFEWIKSVD